MFLPVIKPVFRMILRIISFILFVLTVASAYAGRVDPSYVAVVSALPLLLPYVAVATAIVTTAWLCAGRLFTAAFGVLALVVSWGPVTNAVPLHTSRKAHSEDNRFSLLTYNIIHGWDQQNPGPLADNRSFRHVLESDADLVGLQEVETYEASEIPGFVGALRDSLFRKYPYRAGGGDTDLKVLSRYPVRLVRQYRPEGDMQTRFALYEVEMPWGKLNWINMHMNSYSLTEQERDVVRDMMTPDKVKEGIKEMKGSIRQKLSSSFRQRAAAARELADIARGISGPLIVSGDFNDVPESYAYRTVRDAGLGDACQETTFGPMITYNRHGFWFHLDQIFYKGPLRPLSVKKGRLRSSDHYPLKAEFEYQPTS